MPVVFQPADPVGEGIASAYGATEQFNRMAPHIMQARQQNASRQAAGQAQELDAQVRTNIASGQNITQAAIAGDAMGNERYLMDQRARAASQAQDKQIRAQEQAQYMEWAMQDQRVTQAEVMRMQRQQQALSEIASQVSAGRLTPDEAAEMTMQLKTGISLTQNRMQKQHAEDYAAQAKMRQEEAKTMALNNETFRALQLKAAQGKMTTGMIINHATGTPHFVTVDDKGNIQEIGGGGKAKGPQVDPNVEGSQFQTKIGGFDYAAAAKDAKARAEADPAFMTVPEGGTKPVLNAAGRKWVQDRADGLERQWRESMTGSGKPTAGGKPEITPEQAKQQAVQGMSKVYTQLMMAPPEVRERAGPEFQTMFSLVAKYGSPQQITDKSDRKKYDEAYDKLMKAMLSPQTDGGQSSAYPHRMGAAPMGR